MSSNDTWIEWTALILSPVSYVLSFGLIKHFWHSVLFSLLLFSSFSRGQLCNPVDCTPPGSSVRGVLQARILEWAAFPFSRGSSQPRDRTQVSHIADRFFTVWATSTNFIIVTYLYFFLVIALELDIYIYMYIYTHTHTHTHIYTHWNCHNFPTQWKVWEAYKIYLHLSYIIYYISLTYFPSAW